MFFSKKPAPVPVDRIAEFDRAIARAIDDALADVDHTNFKFNAPRWSRLAKIADRLDDRVKSLRMQLAYRPAI